MEKDYLHIKELLNLGKKTRENDEKKEINEKLYLNLMEVIKKLRDKIKQYNTESQVFFAPILNKLNYILTDVPNTYVINLDKIPEINRGFLEGTFEKIQNYENETNSIILSIEMEKETEKRLAEEEASRHYSFEVIDIHEDADKDLVLFYSALSEINEDYWPAVSKVGLQRGHEDMAVIVGAHLHDYWRPKQGKFGILKPKEMEEYEFILNSDMTDDKNRDRKKNFENAYIRNATQLMLRIQKFTNEIAKKINDPNQNVVPYPDDAVDLKEIKHEDIQENEKFLNIFRGKTKRETVIILNDAVNNAVEELRIQELAEYME